MKLPLVLPAIALLLFAAPVEAQKAAPVQTAIPFGIASGAEWSGDYPRFQPMLRDAGVKWLRLFPEWQQLQPKQGEWNWKGADELLATSKANGIQLTGLLYYFAPWASPGNDTRTFPVKDMLFWREYVAGVVGRYGKEIPYWEVWNEPQAFQKDGTPQHYADMVQAAYHTAKKVDPEVKLGLTSANYALSYLNMVLTRGAADHFDYVCVHPYENMESLLRPGGEVSFLSMAGNLRRLLAAHGQRSDLPLWITELGWQAPIKADAEAETQQAQLLVKAYLLALAQGFERIFWFEARGPAYGKGTDHGIIRADWSPRPAYAAMRTMTAALSDTPKFAGWLDLASGYGFVFDGPGGSVLAAWSPVGSERKVNFEREVTVTDLGGRSAKLPANEALVLTNQPVFVSQVPDLLLKKARSNRDQTFPWGGDFSRSSEVTYRWGAGETNTGIEPLNGTATETADNVSFARVKKGGGLNFRTNPTFAPFGTTNLEIRIVARRARENESAGFQLMTESLKTIHGYDRAGYWTIPADQGWHEHVWRLEDANFVGTWGYNLGITEISGDFLIKEVTVKRLDASPEKTRVR